MQRAQPSSLASGLRAVAAVVEDACGVTIEIVTVGDAPVDGATEALLAAANEALVNAARHAEGAAISMFSRAEGDKISVYVHDRGPGFVLEDVPAQRRGVRDLRETAATLPAVMFLALSVSDAPEDVIELVRAGARG